MENKTFKYGRTVFRRQDDGRYRARAGRFTYHVEYAEDGTYVQASVFSNAHAELRASARGFGVDDALAVAVQKLGRELDAAITTKTRVILREERRRELLRSTKEALRTDKIKGDGVPLTSKDRGGRR